MSDAYMEKLDQILKNQITLAKAVAAVVPIEPPSETGGIYQYVRPDPAEPRYGAGIKMTGPDAAEGIKRACYSVRWNGDQMLTLPPEREDEVWAEIEKLKAGDPELVQKYLLVNPEMAGFALLTELLDPVKYDGFLGQSKRDALYGVTVQSFLDQQFGIDSNPSGNEY
jgi:hypothetical protein